jgi:hypothetical protein
MLVICMIDQYFGVKELYEVALKAKAPMYFGSRYIEAGEPVLYFENVIMSLLNEKNAPILARGGWNNLPRVIWEDRSEVQFSLSEGVMSSISMGVLLSAAVTEPAQEKKLLVPKREGPFKLFEHENEPERDHRIFLEHDPVDYTKKKTFIFEYSRDVAQKKIYGKRILNAADEWGDVRPCIELYKNKELTEYADIGKQYIIDYYYEYGDEALIYTI